MAPSTASSVLPAVLNGMVSADLAGCLPLAAVVVAAIVISRQVVKAAGLLVFMSPPPWWRRVEPARSYLNGPRVTSE
jgi:hypothetical protein